jgi:hypothetical protein
VILFNVYEWGAARGNSSYVTLNGKEKVLIHKCSLAKMGSMVFCIINTSTVFFSDYQVR